MSIIVLALTPESSVNISELGAGHVRRAQMKHFSKETLVAHLVWTLLQITCFRAEVHLMFYIES